MERATSRSIRKAAEAKGKKRKRKPLVVDAQCYFTKKHTPLRKTYVSK